MDQAEVFHSTWAHRAWVGGAAALLSATGLRGLAKVHDPATASLAVAAAVAAYYVAGAAPRPSCLPGTVPVLTAWGLPDTFGT